MPTTTDSVKPKTAHNAVLGHIDASLDEKKAHSYGVSPHGFQSFYNETSFYC